MMEQQPTSAVAANWRDGLTENELAQIATAQEYAAFWAGVPNISVNVLIAKLVALLDDKG